jgi:signal transduction histidine kinase
MNSAQAMQGRGEIRVTLEPVDSLCRVRVRDVGPGIAADVLERIFTPFFTTKARGTGLGLATAKRIVEAHAGQIAIVSSPDEGTTVIIELPTARVVI